VITVEVFLVLFRPKVYTLKVNYHHLVLYFFIYDYLLLYIHRYCIIHFNCDHWGHYCYFHYVCLHCVFMMDRLAIVKILMSIFVWKSKLLKKLALKPVTFVSPAVPQNTRYTQLCCSPHLASLFMEKDILFVVCFLS